jgi:hypothetical protein
MPNLYPLNNALKFYKEIELMFYPQLVTTLC